jgi:hypothetical protein
MKDGNKRSRSVEEGVGGQNDVRRPLQRWKLRYRGGV